MSGGLSRDSPVTSSGCLLPAAAKAYSLNATAVPQGALAFLTLWPAGQAQPLVLTLNPFDRPLGPMRRFCPRPRPAPCAPHSPPPAAPPLPPTPHPPPRRPHPPSRPQQP